MPTPVNIIALFERIEIRLQGRKKMPADEALQLTVIKHCFMDQLAGKGKMKASMDAAFYNIDKGYLKLWGFTLKAHTKNIYYDGYERPDVVKYGKRWAVTMMNYRAKMREYNGEDCSEVVLPTLKTASKKLCL
ncbi:hypothetical protein V1522DRAFT_418680 [Lipomyces starkeyi]